MIERVLGPSLEIFKNLRNGHAIQLRLEWLENRIYWMGELNRADLVTRFGISPQQASADIKLYQNISPTNLLYDPSRKLYVKAIGFDAVFPKNSQQWLINNAGEQAALRSIKLESIAPVKRGVGDTTLSAIARAFRLRMPIAVQYQSMKSDRPEWRVICPHAIVETAIRWHIRAFLVEKGIFADLVPGRILAVSEETGAEWVGGEADIAWNTTANIILMPSKTLTQDQKKIVERDYQMIEGRREIVTRECLVYYQLSSMYLVDAVREHCGEPLDRNFGVAVLNWQELRRFVRSE